MRFRPCIDIHNGRVKQIVGGSLRDEGDRVQENFVSEHPASFYAELYRDRNLSGGHVILLNGRESPYYEETRREAFSALGAWPGGLQAGGGVTDRNAAEYLDAGASHVIVTSYVFRDGKFSMENLSRLRQEVGREHITLDLSCRKKPDGCYYAVTDRWQKFTDFRVDAGSLKHLSSECGEFLVHAVDVEGKNAGIDPEVLAMLAEVETIPVTYAGGVRSLSDIRLIRRAGRDRVDVTVGSALSLFGGNLDLDEAVEASGGEENLQ